MNSEQHQQTLLYSSVFLSTDQTHSYIVFHYCIFVAVFIYLVILVDYFHYFISTNHLYSCNYLVFFAFFCC
jgi:hypothetical protein